MKLVNTENDNLLTNERVQECLVRAKQTRKVIIRYIQASCYRTPPSRLLSDYFFFLQLVENEEIIGTLIESNERIIAALQSYDKVGLHES